MWYISIQQPLEEMRQHAQNVSYSMKRIVFIPLFALAGAGLVIMALLSLFIPVRDSKPPGAGRVLWVILLVVSMVPGWFLYNWFEGEMKKAGYQSGITGAQPAPIPVPKMNIPPPPDTSRLNADLKEMQEKIRKIQDEARKERR